MQHVTLYRIAADTPHYEAHDLTGDVKTLLADVPSVIVPEERNVLINPLHPDVKRMRARKVRRWAYDGRM